MSLEIVFCVGIIIFCVGVIVGMELYKREVLSRPHPAPAQCITTCKCTYHWENCEKCREHDAAIARKEREDVLDKVIAWKRKHGYWFTVNQISGEKRYHFEPDRFEAFIKELRSTTPHSEQEQPR